jgi:tRNA pseudouridine32 synthase/23S rRNA pseudouridine746 synthase
MILAQTDTTLVVDKPAGWLTIPGREGEKDPRPVLSRELSRRFGTIFPVHRLDTEVTGLVVFARTAEAHRVLNTAFEKRSVQKVYEAWTPVVDPKTAPGAGIPCSVERWTSKILRGKKRAYESPAGKLAITKVHPPHKNSFRKSDIFQWKLEPLTGRSHQLRFELARRGLPILGDGLYGSTVEFYPNTIALRAVALELPLDVSKHLGVAHALSVPGLSSIR